jgi:hypothetical protein
MPHRDDMKAGAGVGRGVLLGAALWCIVGLVALAVKSTGDASTSGGDSAHGAAAISVDRGGHTFAR